MRVKASNTPDELAARKLLRDVEKATKGRTDAAIIDGIADRVNEEAADVLGYQSFVNYALEKLYSCR